MGKEKTPKNPERFAIVPSKYSMRQIIKALKKTGKYKTNWKLSDNFILIFKQELRKLGEERDK